MSSVVRPGELERLLRGLGRRPREIGEVVGYLCLGDDRRQRRLAVALGPLVAGQHQRAAAVVYAGGVAGGVRAILEEDRRELRKRLEARVAARGLVDFDDRVAPLALDRHRHDLLGQPSFIGRPDRQLVRAQRPTIHVGTGHLELRGHLAGLLRHVLAGERVRQAVVDHRVDRLAVAHPEPEPRLLQQVGGLRHRLHTATDPELDVAGADRRIEQPGRPDSRGAHLVDRLGGDLVRDAGLDLRLARGDLALAGLDHLTHDHVLDFLGRHVGTLERGLDRGAAELGGIDGRKAAAQLSDRRAGGGQDHGLGHRSVTLRVRWRTSNRNRRLPPGHC